MSSKNSANAQSHPGAWECLIDELRKREKGLLIAGNPESVECPFGYAIRFDGKNDGIFLADNPLKGLTSFSVEVLLRPGLNGPEEQRFLHIGEVTDDRLLIETRLTNDGQWFLDTYIQSGPDQKTLIDPKFVHPIGPWYHVALTLDEKGNMTNYINGKKEINGHVDFNCINTGEMSIGVRRNKVSWYKGEIYRIKISPEALTPGDFILIKSIF